MPGTTPLPGPRRKTARHWIFGILLVLVILVWLAPGILVRSPFKVKIAEWVLPEYRGNLEIGSLQLGWFSPTGLRDVTARDLQGEHLLTIEEINGEKTLLDLFLNPQELGRFQVRRPILRIVVKETLTDLQNVLLPVSGTAESAPHRRNHLRGEFQIQDARVMIVDSSTRLKWKITSSELRVKTVSDHPLGFQLDGSAVVTNDQQISGTVKAWSEKGNVEVQLEAVPLDLAEPFLRRKITDGQIRGLLGGRLLCRPVQKAGMLCFTATADLQVEQFQLASAEYFKNDVLRFAILKANGQLRLQQRRLILDRVQVTNDVAGITVQGTLPLDSLGKHWTGSLATEDCDIHAKVDLARLAQLLPETLAVRKDTELTAGKADLFFTSNKTKSGRRWTGRVNTTELQGTSKGRLISWRNPVQLDFQAHTDSRGTMIDQLTCRSDFIRIDGQGTMDTASFEAQADLSLLVRQLGQFVEVENWQLGGTASAQLKWHADKGHIRAQGQAVVENFSCKESGSNRPWTESRLLMELSALGTADELGWKQVESGSLKITSGTDSLVAQLLSPISRVGQQPLQPTEVGVDLQGNLASWYPRLRPWIRWNDWTVAGQIKMAARISTLGEFTRVESSQVEINDLEASSKSLVISEPVARLEAAGSWHKAARVFRFTRASVACTSFSGLTTGLELRIKRASSPAIQGELAVRGDLNRLSRWLCKQDQLPYQRVQGKLTGGVTFQHSQGNTQCNWNFTVLQPAIEKRHSTKSQPALGNLPVSRSKVWQELWKEDQIRLTGNGTLTQAQDSFQLDDLRITSKLLALQASGAITGLNGPLDIRVTGYTDFEMQNVVQSLQGFLGGNIALQGRRRHPFLMQGPLQPAHADAAKKGESAGLVVQTGLGWKSGVVHGLTLGPTDITAKYSSRWVTGRSEQALYFDSFKVPVNDGLLRAQPRVLLNPPPTLSDESPGPLLLMGQTQLLERVSITREMCAQWLKYLAPLVADVTRIKGRLSVGLTHARIPLADMNSADILGSLTVHSGEIRPGPLTEPFVRIVRRIQSLAGQGILGEANAILRTTEREIPFRLLDGRVYHENMLVRMGDVMMNSSGSVGLDESLDLLVQIQIPDHWVEADRVLAGWKGKVIEIPIGGTLEKPNIDERVLLDLARDLIQDPIQKIIDGGLLRGLDRLLDPDRGQ
ncbi:MAG: hypothetical protein CMJ81_22425 [Planctomycetaceae bacterium]|nr:hypothetical protein [Planctomycetaceae bacterium]MBP62294.1 hypothetical protein [Planctomycetaceae bacterium]